MRALKRIGQIAKDQLTQGVKPERLALGLALAVAVGTFPLLGFSTLSCLALGNALRLNQPFLQAVNYVLYPVQLLLIPVFLRAGEWLFSQPPAPFSPVNMVHDFFTAPAQFLSLYGKSGLLAVAAWFLCALVLCPAIYLISRVGFTSVTRRAPSKEANSA